MTLMDLVKIKAHTHPLTHLLIHQTWLATSTWITQVNISMQYWPEAYRAEPKTFGESSKYTTLLIFFVVVEVFCLEVWTILFVSTAAEPEQKTL